MIEISKITLLNQFWEGLDQLVEKKTYDTLFFKDAHEMATKLNNCLENAIIETEKREV